MCLFRKAPKPPTPPPLAPPPPPPAPPVAPLPQADPLETEVNPQVRRAKSKKEKNPASKGTSALRIPLASAGLNLGTSGGNSLNIPK